MDKFRGPAGIRILHSDHVGDLFLKSTRREPKGAYVQAGGTTVVRSKRANNIICCIAITRAFAYADFSSRGGR